MFVYFFVFLWQCSQLPWHKIFFCCFEINKYISKFVEKVTVKKFWKLSRIKHQQNVNKKTEPLIEYWSGPLVNYIQNTFSESSESKGKSSRNFFVDICPLWYRKVKVINLQCTLINCGQRNYGYFKETIACEV